MPREHITQLIEQITQLIEQIDNNQTNEELDLSNIFEKLLHLNDSEAQENAEQNPLAGSIEAEPNLEKRFFKALSENSSIKKLSITNGSLHSEKHIEGLSEALKKNRSITHLDLSGNDRLSGSGSEPLEEMLKENKTIRSLNIDGTHINITRMIQNIEKSNHSLEEIVFSSDDAKTNAAIEGFVKVNACLKEVGELSVLSSNETIHYANSDILHPGKDINGIIGDYLMSKSSHELLKESPKMIAQKISKEVVDKIVSTESSKSQIFQHRYPEFFAEVEARAATEKSPSTSTYPRGSAKENRAQQLDTTKGGCCVVQ
ncbi:MAG: hypothetical protein O3B09_02845 [Proteobacteria bacterium]|nr:hypothetical protein [Pseudomonadota bacterium]